MKNTIKRFLTWNPHGSEGFTLVELIVVIAILAILAAVAIPAYSGYITKANQQADISLASEVMDALMLYHYSNMDGSTNTNGYVVLTPEGVACAYDDEGVGKAAMDAVFGTGWENTLFVKYDGWKSSNVGASIAGSSFAGKEKVLMDKVNGLSNTLENFLKEYEGNADGFFPFLKGLGIDKDSDPNAAANAAVLYVGEAVKKANQENISNILSGIPGKIVAGMNAGGTYDASQIMLETASALKKELGESTMATAAVMYAYAEAYALATGQTLTIDASNIKDGSSGLKEVQAAFEKLMDFESMTADQKKAMMSWGGNITKDPATNKYVLGEDGTYKKDAAAVMSALNAVNNASDVLKDKDKLTREDLFADSDIQDTVLQYLNASSIGGDGSIVVQIVDGVIFTDPLL